MESSTRHPLDPRSNVAKLGGYNPLEYVLDDVSLTVKTDESLTPNRPPCLTQQTVGKFLQPLTRELNEIPLRPTIDELPNAVIDKMVEMDKAFWVDKPGANAYNLHDAYMKSGMTSEKILPHHQDVFPRSYQYDLDCVKYRREHACDAFNRDGGESKDQSGMPCQSCEKSSDPKRPTVASSENSNQKRWRYYPDVSATLTPNEIQDLMNKLGRPYQNEACNWYYENYPPVKYNCILRKFSK
ncbi:uncharacterized protein LOC126978562 [Leptidea sinapis]|uniref:uncharacterized protein LOC126978562 n=1 Tax=Leptidea sinapis TaxID=189913 RepID=UPI0021379116|nr:uncharacterized protein LOC126978562 [Leptidea sinapis]